MLTEGQASCLVLNWEPTIENRAKAKEYFLHSLLGVTYSYDGNHLEPFSISKEIINKNPYKYKKYPETPDSSPKLTATTTTENEIYELLRKEFPNLHSYHTQNQIANWLTAESDHFGKQSTHRIQQKAKRGRWLWTFKPGVADELVHKSKKRVTGVKRVRGDQYVTEKELPKKRLLNRCFCTKVFVSAMSSSTQPLLLRDTPVNKEVMDRLSPCDGTTQDLCSFLSSCNKMVSLCIIDYAGLSNDPKDVKTFLKINPNIKEIVIDHGDSIEVLDPYALLHKDSASKFKCPIGPIKRSSSSKLISITWKTYYLAPLGMWSFPCGTNG
ncbi:hypothetical protein BDC45DRAFT_538670 [Circinella umbellata]|nr:hypothetical protein BDC45DRAFT_538670 [Circinella umbellata]